MRPPAGAHFSAEWGFIGISQGTTGNWREYSGDVVKTDIRKQAEDPDLSKHLKDAKEAGTLVEDAKDDPFCRKRGGRSTSLS